MSRVSTNTKHQLETPKHKGLLRTELVGRLPGTASQDVGSQGNYRGDRAGTWAWMEQEECGREHCQRGRVVVEGEKGTNRVERIILTGRIVSGGQGPVEGLLTPTSCCRNLKPTARFSELCTW